jgi:trk system potassium uptake protein TrkA
VNVVIIGCGRVGSAVAKQLASEGWDVTCVDEDEEALSRLGAWKGGFVVGHGMDREILERAGATEAQAAVVATDGDNSNIVIGQILQRRYGIVCVVVRLLDPARAEFYAKLGLRTVCPTQTAISYLTEAVRACDTGILQEAST